MWKIQHQVSTELSLVTILQSDRTLYNGNRTERSPIRSVLGATSRGFCGGLAQTILEISGSQLNPLITFSLNI